LRAAGRLGRTVVLRVRFGDFARITRSHTLPTPTAHTATILAALRGLLAAVMPMIERRGVTLLGVAVANLSDAVTVQPELPFDAHRGHSLDAAVDAVRDKFGSSAVTRATLLRREPGLSVPLLPD